MRYIGFEWFRARDRKVARCNHDYVWWLATWLPHRPYMRFIGYAVARAKRKCGVK